MMVPGLAWTPTFKLIKNRVLNNQCRTWSVNLHDIFLQDAHADIFVVRHAYIFANMDKLTKI